MVGFVKINNCYDESNNRLLIIIFSFFFGEFGWLNLGIWKKMKLCELEEICKVGCWFVFVEIFFVFIMYGKLLEKLE